MRIAAKSLAVACALLSAHNVLAGPLGGSSDFDLSMRTLLLSSGDDGDLPSMVMDGYSTYYKRVGTLPNLNGGADYQAIVVSQSSLSDSELADLRAYCARYGTRVVYLNSQTAWTPGVSQSGSSDGSKYIVFDTSAAKDEGVANALNTAGGWLSEGTSPNPVSLSGSNLRPVLRLSNTKGPSGSGGVVAFTATTDNGCEEMHFMMDATNHELDRSFYGRMEVSTGQRYRQLTSLNLALGSMWFPWATRGIYMGKRRMFFVQQIDDVFASSELYGATTAAEKSFRISAGSCADNVDIQNRISSMLPQGSDYRLEFAYNGASYKSSGDALSSCLVKNKDRFHWVSHTWTHQHLDWLNADECVINGVPQENACKTPRSRIMSELGKNAKLMEGSPFNWVSKDNWSPQSLVPPEISGLVPLGFKRFPGMEYAARYYSRPGNFDAFASFRANGITTVTGDNTRPELLQENVFWGLWSDKNTQGEDGILIIPRNAPSIPYNSHTPENMVKAWKELGACEYTPGESCSNFDFSFESAITRDGLAFVPYVLQFRYDPLMFHQANMNTFTYDGEVWSLVTLYAQKALTEVMSFINKLPIVSPPMDKLGQLYRERERRDKCGLQGVIKYRGGQPVDVQVSGTGKCTAVVTFDQSAEAQPSTGLSKERYGPDTTVNVPINGNTADISLTPTDNRQAVILPSPPAATVV